MTALVVLSQPHLDLDRSFDGVSNGNDYASPRDLAKPAAGTSVDQRFQDAAKILDYGFAQSG
ncbi:hypothetical protein [Streptomyces puniciscabiei]|uniref:hypothetical protein n=1 Tax=Streptomyces puniciscabiei TaxID=164348 RepID=UPI00331E1EA7